MRQLLGLVWSAFSHVTVCLVVSEVLLSLRQSCNYFHCFQLRFSWLLIVLSTLFIELDLGLVVGAVGSRPSVVHSGKLLGCCVRGLLGRIRELVVRRE